MRITVKRAEEVPNFDFTQISTVKDFAIAIQKFKNDNLGVISVEISQAQANWIMDFMASQTSYRTPIYLTDRMRESFYSKGMIPGFMGLNWYTQQEPTTVDVKRIDDDYIWLTEDVYEDGERIRRVTKYARCEVTP